MFYFIGECYSGPDEGRYDEDREASEDMCESEEQKTCVKDDKQSCAGIIKKDKETNNNMYANYVYTIITETHKEIARIE